jgi:hypothetical protein
MAGIPRDESGTGADAFSAGLTSRIIGYVLERGLGKKIMLCKNRHERGFTRIYENRFLYRYTGRAPRLRASPGHGGARTFYNLSDPNVHGN